MSRLIIIRGNSGSGKSTIAERLQVKLGYQTMLIPQDVVRREILRTRDLPDNPAIGLIKQMAIYGRSINYDVIVEGILVRERYMEMLSELIGSFDEVHTYYFDISFEETLRRHGTKSNANEFGEPEMREWYTKEDMLGLPGERVFSDSQSENEVLSLIMADLGGL